MKSLFSKFNRFKRSMVVGVFCVGLLVVLSMPVFGKDGGKGGYVFSRESVVTDFKAEEMPNFQFKFEKNARGVFWLYGKARGLFKDDYQNMEIAPYVVDSQNNEVSLFAPKVMKEKNGAFKIELQKNQEIFTPGKYRLQLKIKDNAITAGETLDYFQDFNWGVLAINFNKSIYQEDEEAYIQMAVLNEIGSTMCDADLVLEIDAPGIFGGETQSTGDKTIVMNPVCGPNNVVKEPDYYSHFKLTREGTYIFKLIATTRNGVYEISDKVEVKNNQPFEIERIGPTRIFPWADYDMTIKIKANEDFEGEIVETVPESFKILNSKFEILNQSLKTENSRLPDGQVKLKIEGSEQKLVWENVNFKKGDEINIKYELDAPNISPEFYLLGPFRLVDTRSGQANILFSEARKWQIASDASPETPTKAMMVYGDNTVGTPKYRIWDGAQWGNEQSAVSVGASAINWVVTRANPNKVEYVTATIAANGTAYAQVFKDGSWGNLQSIGTVTNFAYKGVDIAYETSSGDAIVVVTDGDADPSYYVWNGTSWTGPSTVNLSSTANSAWVYLTSHPTSDQIVIAAMDINRNYRFQVWNGTVWGNERIPTALAAVVTAPGIALSYKTTSGDAVVSTADSTNGNTYTSTWNGSTWSESLDAGIGNDFYVGTMKSDPNSNKLAMNYVDADSDMGGSSYDGTSWGWTEINTTGNANTDRCIDAEFETTTGRNGYIMTVYSTTNALLYAYYNGSTWNSGNLISGGPYAHTVQLARTGEGKILGLFFDEANQDYDFSFWDGSAWSAIQLLEDLPSRTVTPFKEPFMMAAARYAIPVPKSPVFYNSDASQISFNNIKQATTTPTFRVSASSNGAFDAWEIQLSASSSFATFVNQTFSGTYASGTIYNLLCNNLGWSPVNDTTYYVRARAATSSNWGDWSSETWTFTYSSEPSATATPEWLQTTFEQFETGTFVSAESYSTNSVWLPNAGTTTVVVSGAGTETWDVPTDISAIEVKAWGAGGGGGGGDQAAVAGGDGGGGGFVKGVVLVTAGETLTIDVGDGGVGGPGGANQGGGGGGGGGYSAVRRGTNNLLVAGAGAGGGGGDDNTNGPGGAGGAGGGSTGVTGGNAGGGNAPGGVGGSQVGGGAGGNGPNYDGAAGTSLAGGAGGGENFMVTGGAGGVIGGAAGGGDSNDGNDMGGGGGGGAGYYGGGGGANANTAVPQGAAGGGGGSSYATTTATSVANTAGSGTTPGNSGDVDYGDAAGSGGAGSALDAVAGSTGNPGRVVINYYKTYSTGTVMSTMIDFDYAVGMKKWHDVTWNTTETQGDVVLKLYYTVSATCDTLVPNSALSGNSTGFDVSASPLNISGLNTTTYNQICLKATLTKGATASPTLNDWKVSWLPGPRLTAVSIPNTMYKVGDVLTSTITVKDSPETYTLGTSTINGVTLSGANLSKINNTTYNLTYTIANGDTDRTAGTIPISIRLVDGHGAISDAFTTPNANTASIDAHPPVVQTVSITNGTYKIGSAISVLIDTDASGYTESVITVNGKSITNFTDNGNTTYSVTYTVAEGDTDRAAGTIPVSVVLKDSYNNINTAYTATESNTASVDAHRPNITGISLPNLMYKIGDTVTATITIANDAGYTGYVLATSSINAATSSTGNLQKINATTLTISYTVVENHTDRAAGTIPVVVVFYDAAGNLGNTFSTVTANTASIDAHKPVISDVAFSPSSGVLKVGATATSTITADAIGYIASTITINGVNVAASLYDNGNNTYRITYTVAEGNTDHPDSDDLPVNISLRDASGNISVAYTTISPSTRPGVDGHKPVISNVTFSPSSGVLKVGATATSTITADATGYTANSITINGVNVAASLYDNGNNTYRVTYTVVEGNTDILDSNDLPISISLRDAAGNNSTAYTTADAANRPGVDGHKPVISNVTFSPSSGVLKVGATGTSTITADATGYTANSITINGVNVAASLYDNGDNTYRVTYTVVEGNTDILDSNDLPISISLRDTAGNNSTAYTTADAANRPGVDGHKPVISDVTFSPSSGILKVGDKATSTITADAAGYSAGTMTINLSNVASTFHDNGDNTYTVVYTVTEGDVDRVEIADLPVYFIISDSAGNNSTVYTTADAANRPGVDGHKPVISNVTFSPSSGVLKVGATATSTITADATGYTANSITINGVNVAASLYDNGNNTYRVTYTVVEGNTDILDANDLPISISLRDAAGNNSTAYTTADAANRPGVDGHKPVISNVTFSPSSGVLKVGATGTSTITADATGYTANSITINGVNVAASLFDNGNNTYRVTYTVVEGNTDILDSNDLPISISLRDTAGNNSTAYTTVDAANRPGVDAHLPTTPGPLSLSAKQTYAIILNFGATTTEANFSEYKIFYKAGTSGVTENDTIFNSGNDANLGNKLFNGAATTTIPNLQPGTEYVFNIWAYDLSGNKKSGTEFSVRTNYLPQNPSLIIQTKNNGVTNITNNGWTNENNVKLKASALDFDTSEILSLYFQLVPTASSTLTATSVPANACNSTDAFNSCVSKVWKVTSAAGNYSATPYTGEVNPTSIPDSATGYKWQVLACDDNNVCSSWTAGLNFKVDVVNPTTPGDLSFNNKDVTFVIFNLGATTTEINFLEYRIYYKVGTSGVTENDSLFASTSDADLGNINFNASTTVTINNLSANTDYVFNIWAYDKAGNKANATEVTVKTDLASNPPTGNFNSVAQKTDGSGKFDISIEVDDVDNDDTLRAQLEYEAGSSCSFVSAQQLTIDATDDNVTADFGDPDVDNTNQYQVGTSSNWIITSPGSNTVNFDWQSASDLPDTSGTYCLRLTVNDGLFDQTVVATTTVYIDNVLPTTPGPLSLSAKQTYAIVLYLGATTTEANFSEYKIFYKAGTSGVTENDTIFNSGNDANLGNKLFNGAATTTIPNLQPGTEYVFNIWAYDLSGNKKSGTEFSVRTNYLPQNPNSITQLKNDGITTIVNNGWTNESNVKLKASVLDSDTSEILSLYFQLVPTASSTLTATSVPANACNSTDAFNSCVSKVWKVTSAAGNYSATPYTGEVNPTSIPDSATGYKWQVLACDDNNVCSSWTAGLNFKVDVVNPTTPGDLVYNSRTSNSITLNFGTVTTETNFLEYRIYYKAGTTGVAETDSLFASTTDANLAYINYNGAGNTTINSLSAGTNYVFNIWAYDRAGNKAQATEVTVTTNSRPTGQLLSVAQKTDGTGKIDLSILTNDANQENLRAKLEYVSGAACNFSSPFDPTLDEDNATATSTYGDAKVLNSATYQVGNASGWIITSSGANTVNFDWLSKTDLNNVEGDYCLRLTANDNIDDQLAPATSTVYIDNLAPTAPGNLTLNSLTGTSITLNFGASTTETNFSKYRIFYKEGAGTVTENDTEKIDTNLNFKNYNGKATTTITGLNNNTQYSFKIFAYDTYGNKTASNQAIFVTNAPPTGVFNSVAQKIDGSGKVDVSIEVYDVNGDLVQAKLEYVAGAACNFAAPLDPTLDETQSYISADYGTPGIANAQSYQIGTSTSKIITSSGSNTINFDWLTQSNIPTADGDYCLRLTVNDGYDDQVVLATTTIIVDNLAPTAPASLTTVLVSGINIAAGFGAPSVDTNFSEYKIFYKAGASGVTEANSQINKYIDPDLAFANFNGATSTLISPLQGNTQYVYNIWAYDLYGNKASSSAETSSTTLSILSATWRESEDDVLPTVGNYLGRNENVRLRLAVVNSGDWNAADNSFQLEYGTKVGDCASVSDWQSVPTTATSEAFQTASSLYFNNLDQTTSRLSTGGYSFVPGDILQNPSSSSSLITLDSGKYTEVEYTFEATAHAVSGLTYCFRAVNDGEVFDTYGVYPELSLAPPPAATFNSAAQRSDGSFKVNVSMEVEDLGKELNRVKVEYVAGANCNFASPLDPTLSTINEDTSAVFGDPIIDNSSEYQIGTSSGMILTAYGANTVNFVWNTSADLTNADNIYCLRITANDGVESQTVSATTTVIVDHINPTIPGNLTRVRINSNSVELGLGTSTEDTNFSDYRIYYKEGSSGVTNSDTLWGTSSDANLDFENYNNATTTTITGLTVNRQYVFNIWAYDEFGNEAVAGQELVILIRYQFQSEIWRWYFDRQNETPTSPMSNENVTPSNVARGNTVKLRMGMREIENILGENIKMRLQYSTFSDFSSDVNFVEEIGSSSAWTYGDGVDTDNDPISATVLFGLTVGSSHNESGISTTTYDHVGGSAAEWEFTLRNNVADDNVVYYFRPFDTATNEHVPKKAGGSYPSLITGAGTLTYAVSGFSAGNSTEGVTANVTSTADSVPFGDMVFGAEKVAVHRLNISTNMGSGYQLYVYQRQNLLNSGGDSIAPVSYTNESPNAWPTGATPSAFGYHTGDDTLSGGFSSRFAPNNTYAKFEDTLKEISYSPIPVQNEIVDMVLRLEVENSQEAGQYYTNMVYILVPSF